MRFLPASPCSLAPPIGGALWAHLLSRARPQQPGLGPDSSLERMKTQLGARLSLRTPAALPPRRPHLQDHPAAEPLQTCGSLRPAQEAPSRTPPRGTERAPTAQPGPACSWNLPKTLSGRLGVAGRRGPGQSSDAAPPWGLSWVREGAGRVLGGCGRGRGQGPLSVGKASLRAGGGAWTVREEQARQWAAEMLVALEALHAQGVICRDLNPRNLLLDQAGECPSPATRSTGAPNAQVRAPVASPAFLCPGNA